jgi:hypothetical protein
MVEQNVVLTSKLHCVEIVCEVHEGMSCVVNRSADDVERNI